MFVLLYMQLCMTKHQQPFERQKEKLGNKK